MEWNHRHFEFEYHTVRFPSFDSFQRNLATPVSNKGGAKNSDNISSEEPSFQDRCREIGERM